MNKNNCQAIHETGLKTIIDLYDSLKNAVKGADDVKSFFKRKNPEGFNPMMSSSIAKQASNLVLVFPVICSRGISIENASMISRAVEKNSVTMLQRLFAAHQIANDKDGSIDNVMDYISGFHKNLSTQSITLDDIFDVVDGIENKQNTSIKANEQAIYDEAIKYDMKNLNFYLPTSVSDKSLNSFMVSEGTVLESDYNRENDNPDLAAAEIASKQASKAKTEFEKFGKQVVDSEYKKANELMPTQMIINFKYGAIDKDGNTKEIGTIDSGVIGVKAKLYPIGSEDVVKHLVDKTNDRNWITNFFRATTREISFMKDLVLAIDKAKIDAMSMSLRNSTSDKMWKVLERRATVSRLKRAMRQNNSAAAAITTLCISQEEVEYIRKNYNIDIERLNVALGLFDSLNLIAICIVDEALEVAKFIYDERDPSWETISFTHLERESSDNTYKRVVNLMTKISR